ncbi:tetratricopeptide repeat protein [Sphingomonas profundi]|uniref:tetratricopeptide repeat protein n=1 Tax=Alterirhizorhabdus profundi TaxID=2681549 RepID=UPI0012E7F5DF|nr:tetratricopeptide repeat protein [Sphingomonas profundi]
MKFVSTMALGVALALGGAAIVGVAPAVAKEKAEKPAKAKSYNLSKPVREAVAAAQAALAKGDAATAQASVSTALAAATTPDDKYVASSVQYEIAAKSNDQAKISDAVDGMLASGVAPADQQVQLYAVQGKLAYNAKNMAKSEQALQQAVTLGTTDPDVYALLVEAKARAGKPAEAITMLETSIAKQKAAGQKVPSEWYGRGIAIAYGAKLPNETERLTQAWLADYPASNNWRDSLITYRDLHKLDADYNLDLMRLMRTAKALKGERDYSEYAEAVYLKYPGEGKSVLDEGVAAGMVKLTAGSNFKFMSDQAGGRVAADKADLASASKAAKASATGKSAAATADSYLGYGDYASAIDLYNVALQKGGVDANTINTRLGMALAKAGRKDEAKAAFAKITGPRASLAKYWMIYLDAPAAA